MMNQVQVFNNSEFGSVRTLVLNGKKWFVGKDQTDILKYERSSKAITDRVDEEDRLWIDSKTQSQIGIELGQRGGWIINISGVFSLILGSKLPTAKKFKHWITSEVLPSIMETGSYTTAEGLMNQVANNPREFAKLLIDYADTKDERDKLKAQAEIDAPKVEFANALIVNDKCYSFKEASIYLCNVVTKPARRDCSAKCEKISFSVPMDNTTMRHYRDG